jgi:hypothetical protein
VRQNFRETLRPVSSMADPLDLDARTAAESRARVDAYSLMVNASGAAIKRLETELAAARATIARVEAAVSNAERYGKTAITTEWVRAALAGEQP